MRDEKKTLGIAFIAIFVNSLLTLYAPLLMANAINTYFINKDFHGVLIYSGILLGMYLLRARRKLCADPPDGRRWPARAFQSSQRSFQ